MEATEELSFAIFLFHIGMILYFQIKYTVRMAMAGSCGLQLLVILGQILCLRLERLSKINALAGYTKWYFTPNLLFSAFSMTIYLTTVIDSDFHKTFAISVYAVRTFVILVLSVLSFCWDKNFDVKYSENIMGLNNQLGVGLIGKQSMHGGSTSGRRSNLGASLIGNLPDVYNIQVSERFTVKTLPDGNTIQYFSIVASQGDKKFPKVERSYKDFKSLEIAMNNNLRSNDIDCPKLERTTTITDLSDWSDTSDASDRRFVKFCSESP